MSRRRSHETISDVISTVVFLGIALYAFLTGFGVLDAGEPMRAAGIWLSSLLCFLGACRFIIARIYDQIIGRAL